MTNNFDSQRIGDDPRWWTGIIVGDAVWKGNQESQKWSVVDQLSGWGSRYKVRIVGKHTQDKTKLPDDRLELCEVLYPVTAGTGHAASYQTSNLRNGSVVFGIYKDNYAYEIPFKITARIDGVEHLKTYNESVVITYQGEGYLNNEFLESGSEVSENGTHTLKVFGEGGYLELVTFKIETEPTLSTGDWIERSLLGGSFCLAGWFFIREFRRFRKRSTTP